VQNFSTNDEGSIENDIIDVIDSIGFSFNYTDERRGNMYINFDDE